MNSATLAALRGIAGLVLASGLFVCSGAQAANHALIMTIDYAGTEAKLPADGIEADGRMGAQIALGMGVPKENIVWLRNQELSLNGMVGALKDVINRRIQPGDKVFLYYSGHGAQASNATGSSNKCSEALVTGDLKYFVDADLESALDQLAAKASQVVMLNDSCFSGGQATKDLRGGLRPGEFAKVYVPKSGSANDAGYVCGEAVNKALSRALGVVDKRPSTRILYVAASADNEVSLATSRGSIATLAWSQCLGRPGADRNGDGIVDGEELRICAQEAINGSGAKQTITVVGESRLPLSFTAASGGGNAPVANPAQALETLRHAADPAIKVDIQVANPRLRIRQDYLQFAVRTSLKGYLYLLHVSSEGRLYQLFPNAKDKANDLPAGTYEFPKSTWAIQALGPEGTGYIMAYLSPTPRDFSKGMQDEGPFKAADATAGAVRALGVVALDNRFGASSVVAVQEVK